MTISEHRKKEMDAPNNDSWLDVWTGALGDTKLTYLSDLKNRDSLTEVGKRMGILWGDYRFNMRHIQSELLMGHHGRGYQVTIGRRNNIGRETKAKDKKLRTILIKSKS